MDPKLSPGLCIATKCSIVDLLGPLFYMSAEFSLNFGTILQLQRPITYIITHYLNSLSFSIENEEVLKTFWSEFWLELKMALL